MVSTSPLFYCVSPDPVVRFFNWKYSTWIKTESAVSLFNYGHPHPGAQALGRLPCKETEVLIGNFVGMVWRFFSPKMYQFLHNTLSPAVFFQLNTVNSTAKGVLLKAGPACGPLPARVQRPGRPKAHAAHGPWLATAWRPTAHDSPAA